MIGNCSRCQRERLIYAKGLCTSCYVYFHYDRAKAKKSEEKWRKKHRDYWKKYFAIPENREKARVRAREYWRLKHNVQHRRIE